MMLEQINAAVSTLLKAGYKTQAAALQKAWETRLVEEFAELPHALASEESFTVMQVQEAWEAEVGKQAGYQDTFRRRIAHLIEPTGVKRPGPVGRPAELFKAASK